jgi:SpoVK/Ycf46/Vps4 family AAA+-type ATPase
MDLLKKRKNIGKPPNTLEEMPTEIIDLLETDSCDSQTDENKTDKIDKTDKRVNKKIALPCIMEIEDELTLDYVLNVFDGIIELYNAMIIFTTNAKLEYFDPALIRPGRIDTIIELKECSRQTLRDIIQYYFRLSEDEMVKHESELLALPEYFIRPSELEELCIKSSDVNDVIQKIVNFRGI